MDSQASAESLQADNALLPPITGRTRIYGILADPIYHVKTPEVMNALFKERGVSSVLVPFHVKPDGLKDLVDGLRRMENFGGFIATVPHKTDMLALCDAVTDAGRHIGAVNCIRREPDGRMVGTMLDGIGFVRSLQAQGVDPAGLKVYLAGAGGVSSAIAFALAEAGARHITVANRTVARARALAGRLQVIYPTLSVSTDSDDVASHDLVINGTSLGMRPDDKPPLDLAQLHAGQLVADAIMEPALTPLLAAAKERGCRIFMGKPMLEAQIALMARHMGALG